MPRSKAMLNTLQEAKGEMLAPIELLSIVLLDPLLCLRLLREAERRKSHRLDHETTTALAAIMQLGIDEFRELLLSSKEIEEANTGLLEVESRATVAAQVAQRWALGRNDLNPEEVAVAALLADAGELLLWVYEPELPQAAREALLSGRARRSSQAQVAACGFDFKQLTMRCAELWQLPVLVLQLLRGVDSPRANLTRICSNVARHIVEASATSDLALASDLVEARRLMPGASLEWLVDGLVMLPEEHRIALMSIASELQERQENA
ncbi:HDOD domain-containing protein [Sulfuritalea hydrogenivorans]|jgi:HD-like signal output (HDOD) protein|nr:HDOD domain-containing protein [Sulfuritalea hydrogenivorans]